MAGVGFLGKSVTGVAPKDLKSLADAGKTSLVSGVVVFVGAGEDGKASVVVGVTDDLTKRFSAVDLVRTASAALGGQGGGRYGYGYDSYNYGYGYGYTYRYSYTYTDEYSAEKGQSYYAAPDHPEMPHQPLTPEGI